MTDIVLYIHILAAASWVGGAMLLFALGIFMRDKEAMRVVYHHMGPIYGYFESVVLVILLSSGTYLYMTFGLHNLWHGPDVKLAEYLYTKIFLVGLIIFATVVHMYISLSAHGRERSQIEKIISRGTSLGIFVLNLFILYFAIQIRSIL
jgi:putative copper export protein